MDQGKKRVVLPNREEMLARLIKADGNIHLQQHLYPILLTEAGTEKTAGAIARWIGLALYDYAAQLPGPMVVVMLKFSLDYVNVLVDDREIAIEAMLKLREVLESEGITVEAVEVNDNIVNSEFTCDQPMGYVADNTDCDDSDSSVTCDDDSADTGH